MAKVRKAKSKFTDARYMRSASRKSKARRDRAVKYLERCEIKLLDGLPQDLDSFLVFWEKRRDRKNPGFISFSRHCCTNYDQICHNLYWRFAVAMTPEMKEVIHPRIFRVVCPYLDAIGFLAWYDKHHR